MATFNELFAAFDGSPDYLAEEVKIEVAKMIEELMDLANVSKAELATRMGCSKPYISNALKGDSNFSILSLAKFATALDGQLKVQILRKPQRVRFEGCVEQILKRKPQQKAPVVPEGKLQKIISDYHFGEVHDTFRQAS